MNGGRKGGRDSVSVLLWVVGALIVLGMSVVLLDGGATPFVMDGCGWLVLIPAIVALTCALGWVLDATGGLLWW